MKLAIIEAAQCGKSTLPNLDHIKFQNLFDLQKAQRFYQAEDEHFDRWAFEVDKWEDEIFLDEEGKIGWIGSIRCREYTR